MFIMGVIGNVRYGKMWKWYDSSMIMELGKANFKFPAFIPDIYFWSYLYAVQPLATLNNNINLTDDLQIFQFIENFIPNFISEKIGINNTKIDLLDKSLNVSTGYSAAAKLMGVPGMFIFFFAYISVTFLIVYRCSKNNSQMLVTISNLLAYFLLLTVFDNTFKYSISFLLLFLSMIFCRKYKVGPYFLQL